MGKLIFDYVGNADMYWITDENGVFKASVKHFDDANRLVASYNACKGIPVTLLEFFPLKLDVHEADLERLKAQNAQLRESLVWLKTEMEKSSDGGKIWCAIRTKPGAVD